MRYTIKLQADGRSALMDDNLCYQVYPTTQAAIEGLRGILRCAKAALVNAQAALAKAQNDVFDAGDELSAARHSLETLECLYNLESQDGAPKSQPYTGKLTYCS